MYRQCNIFAEVRRNQNDEKLTHERTENKKDGNFISTFRGERYHENFK